MRVVFHPEFHRDIRKFEARYSPISQSLAARFRQEVDDAVAAIQTSPRSAGHLLNFEFSVVSELRRKICGPFLSLSYTASWPNN
jgi:hypothetical protein